MFSLVVFKRRRWLRSRKLAEKYVGHARLLIPSQDPADVHSAISLLDAALKLSPQWEKALELKARALLSLRRFKDVANMLQDYIPSMKSQLEKSSPPESPLFGKDKVQLLSNFVEERSRRKSLLKYLALNKLKKILITGLSRRHERSEWRYLVLGQACCHLGMMEDAMILLQNGKKAACAAFRRESISLGEDSFCSDAFAGPDADFVSHLLGNIKFLIRRRAAALAAMEAGLYPEAVRHFSKILDGRRGTPQGFIAECYLYRALAHKANGKIPDAIADCNRTLCLDPTCVQALSVRASLYEMVRCFFESLQDLKQLKGLYDALAQQQRLPRSAWRFPHNSSYADVPGSLYLLDSKIGAVKLRLESRYTIDYHTILGLTTSCTKAEVERAHLLICLKHRPDKASHFIDRCEFVDERDLETVKEEARLAAIRLFRLIQNAHSGVMQMLLEEEDEKRRSGRPLRSVGVGTDLVRSSDGDAKGRDIVKTMSSSIQFRSLLKNDHVRQRSSASSLVTRLWCPARSIDVEDLLDSPDCGSETPPTDFRPRVEANEQDLILPADSNCPVAISVSTQAHSLITVSVHGQASDASEVVVPEASNNATDAVSSQGELLAVETQLAIVLSPRNWINSGGDSSSWSFQTHHNAMQLQGT